MKRLSLSAVVAACVLALAGCGGTSHQSTTASSSTSSATASRCPVDQSFMGCASGVSPRFTGVPPVGGKLGLIAGPRFPDVSSWQGHPNWAAAKPSIVGAVAKLGEGTFTDPDATYNIAAFRHLGIPFAGYWFVRPSGCAAEGSALKREALALGVKRVVLDEEVSGIGGYAACLNPYARAATGQSALVYRSAGNDEDSSASPLGCWVAAYGPSSPPSCFGRSPLAWQYASPPYESVYIPGLGYGDVSISYGFFSSPKPKPTKLVCFGKRATPKAVRCKPIIALYDKRRSSLTATRRVLGSVTRELRQLQATRKTLTRRQAWFAAQQARTLKTYS